MSKYLVHNGKAVKPQLHYTEKFHKDHLDDLAAASTIDASAFPDGTWITEGVDCKIACEHGYNFPVDTCPRKALPLQPQPDTGEDKAGRDIKAVIQAYMWIRANNNTIPIYILDLMKEGAIKKIRAATQPQPDTGAREDLWQQEIEKMETLRNGFDRFGITASEQNAWHKIDYAIDVLKVLQRRYTITRNP